MSSSYDDYNDQKEEMEILNWNAISSLPKHIDFASIRAIAPNLMNSRVTRSEFRNKTDYDISKAFRAIQICGEMFHSISRNANEELLAREKTLKEMSSLLRDSERQLRKYRTRVKNLNEEKKTSHEILRQYRHLTSTSSSSSSPPIQSSSLLCRKCLTHVHSSHEDSKKIIVKRSTLESREDVRSFLENAVERLRVHFKTSHEKQIEDLKKDCEKTVEEMKVEAKNRFDHLTKRAQRISLKAVDRIIRRRMISWSWCNWRYYSYLERENQMISEYEKLESEMKKQDLKSKKRESQMNSEMKKQELESKKRESQMKNQFKIFKAEIQRLRQDNQRKENEVKEIERLKNLEMENLKLEFENERIEIQKEKKKWQSGAKRLNMESHEVSEKLARLESELEISRQKCERLAHLESELENSKKKCKELRELKERWKKEAKKLLPKTLMSHESHETRVRILQLEKKVKSTKQKCMQLQKEKDALETETRTLKSTTERQAHALRERAKQELDKARLRFVRKERNESSKEEEEDSLVKKEEKEVDSVSKKTKPYTISIPTKPRRSSKPKLLSPSSPRRMMKKKENNQAPLILLVLDYMLREPLGDYKNGLSVPLLFREEPEESLKVDAMKLLIKECSRFEGQSSSYSSKQIQQCCESLKSICKNRPLLTSLMKMYLTSMPKRVLSVLSWSVLYSFRVESTATLPLLIRDLISTLSPKHSAILSWVLPFLKDVSEFSKGTTIESLSICLAPALFEPMEIDMKKPLKSMQDQMMYMKIAAHMLCLLVRHDALSRIVSHPAPPSTPPPKESRWECVYRGVRCRSDPENSDSIIGVDYVVREGDVVTALEHRVRAGWIKILIRDREVWVPLRHKTYGKLFQKLVLTSPRSLARRHSAQTSPKLPPRDLFSNVKNSSSPSLPSRNSNLTKPSAKVVKPPSLPSRNRTMKTKHESHFIEENEKPSLPPRNDTDTTMIQAPSLPPRNRTTKPKHESNFVEKNKKPCLPPRNEMDERVVKFDNLQIGCVVLVRDLISSTPKWNRADVVKINREKQTCDLLIKDSKVMMKKQVLRKGVRVKDMRLIEIFERGTLVDFWNGARWISDVKIVGSIDDSYDVAWKAPPQRLHNKWIRRHRHERVEREMCRPKSPTRAPLVRDALAVMKDVRMMEMPESPQKKNKAGKFKRFGRAVLNSLTAVRLFGGIGRRIEEEEEKEEEEKKKKESVPEIRDASFSPPPSSNSETSFSPPPSPEDSQSPTSEPPTPDTIVEIKSPDTLIDARDTEEDAQKETFRSGDRVFCLKKNSNSIWFPGRVCDVIHEKKHVSYVITSDDNDEKRIVYEKNLIAVEEEEFQSSEDSEPIKSGTRVFGLHIDADGNFHWLLGTVTNFENAESIFVLYDEDSKSQRAELVWCLKNVDDYGLEKEDSSIFDDTESSMDEDEEAELKKRFRSGETRLHRKEKEDVGVVVRDIL